MDIISRIKRLLILANNFKIKPTIIQMVQANQFVSSLTKDSNLHTASFLEICDILKHNGVFDDAIILMHFPFSLKDKVKILLHSLLVGSITTRDVLAQQFFGKSFPLTKTTKITNEIDLFTQHDMERLKEA